MSFKLTDATFVFTETKIDKESKSKAVKIVSVRFFHEEKKRFAEVTDGDVVRIVEVPKPKWGGFEYKPRETDCIGLVERLRRGQLEAINPFNGSRFPLRQALKVVKKNTRTKKGKS